MAQSFRFQVLEKHAGLRLDQSVSAHLPEISRTLAKRLLAQGSIFLDKKRVKVAGRITHTGQKVEVHLLDNSTLRTLEKNEPPPKIKIVEKNEHYVVIEKPAGVFSAPTKESDKNNLVSYLGQQLKKEEGTEQQLFLIHRLDRPTSGLMVLARTKKAAASLSAQVEERSMRRIYLALVVGELKGEPTCEEPIQGREALTTFHSVEAKGGATLVRAQLGTGRTHQVRIHLEFLGTPVAGDSKYGRFQQRALASKPPRMALHACELRFRHPKTHEARLFKSPLPTTLQEWWDGLKVPPTGIPPTDC